MEHVVGLVDVGGTKTMTALMIDGQLHHWEKHPTEPERGPDSVIKGIHVGLEGLVRQAGVSWRNMAAVGLCVPGPIDRREGIVRYAANLDWHDYPVGAVLAAALGGIPVFVDDDAVSAALGEAFHGAGQGHPVVWYSTLSTGIGSALIVDGQPYRGAHQMAGEIGHMTVSSDGPDCSCGKKGCLEAWASGPALLRRAQWLMKTGTYADVVASTPELFGRYYRNDPVAIQVIEEALDYVGRALASVIGLLDPEILILGGGVMVHHGDRLLPKILAATERHLLGIQREHLAVVVGQLGEAAGLWGAYEVVRRQKVGEKSGGLGI